MSRDPIRNEFRGLDNWLTREPRDYDEPVETDELADWIAELQSEGLLGPIADAPKDGSEFKAILEETGETVTVFYREDYRHYLNEDRWQDANGDDAPDGFCRTWGAEDFAGWLLPAKSEVA